MHTYKILIVLFVVIAFVCFLTCEIWSASSNLGVTKHSFTISQSIKDPPVQYLSIIVFFILSMILVAASTLMQRIGVINIASSISLYVSSILLFSVSCVSLNLSTTAHYAVAGTFFLSIIILICITEFSVIGRKKKIIGKIILALVITTVISLLIAASVNTSTGSTVTGVLEYVLFLLVSVYLLYL